MSQTQLIITNSTTGRVKLYLTLGATPGSVQDVSKIPFVSNPISGKPLQGYFYLDAGESTKPYAPTAGIGVNGNISFDSPPINCATTEFPLAVNLAEFILNNGYQGSGSQETIDISGVAGTNAQFSYEMSGGTTWNAGSTEPKVTSFKNESIGNNYGKVGVYPYLCDICTGSTAPPHCTTTPTGAPNPLTPQKDAICNVQRNAVNSGGGTVTINLLQAY